MEDRAIVLVQVTVRLDRLLWRFLGSVLVLSEAVLVLVIDVSLVPRAAFAAILEFSSPPQTTALSAALSSIPQTGLNGTMRVIVSLDPAESHRFCQVLPIVEDRLMKTSHILQKWAAPAVLWLSAAVIVPNLHAAEETAVRTISGLWSDPAGWANNTVPNNDDTTTFVVSIESPASPVDLDMDARIRTLGFSGSLRVPSAGPSGALWIDEAFTWSGGTLNGVEVTVGGEFRLNSGGATANQLDGAHLTLNGDNLLRSTLNVLNGATLINNSEFNFVFQNANLTGADGTFFNNGRVFQSGGFNLIEPVWEQTADGVLDVSRRLRFMNNTTWAGEINLMGDLSQLQLHSTAGGPTTHVFDGDIAGVGSIEIQGTTAAPANVTINGRLANGEGG